MNRLAMIAATGFLAVLLTACGDNGASKPADDKTTDTTVQQTQPADDAETTQPTTDGQSH